MLQIPSREGESIHPKHNTEVFGKKNLTSAPKDRETLLFTAAIQDAYKKKICNYIYLSGTTLMFLCILNCKIVMQGSLVVYHGTSHLLRVFSSYTHSLKIQATRGIFHDMPLDTSINYMYSMYQCNGLKPGSSAVRWTSLTQINGNFIIRRVALKCVCSKIIKNTVNWRKYQFCTHGT